MRPTTGYLQILAGLETGDMIQCGDEPAQSIAPMLGKERKRRQDVEDRLDRTIDRDQTTRRVSQRMGSELAVISLSAFPRPPREIPRFPPRDSFCERVHQSQPLKTREVAVGCA